MIMQVAISRDADSFNIHAASFLFPDINWSKQRAVMTPRSMCVSSALSFADAWAVIR